MPTQLNLVAIKQKLMQKNKEDLLEILTYSQKDYQPEVIPLIKEILIEKSVDYDTIIEADKQYQEKFSKSLEFINKQENSQKLPKIILWLMYLSGLCMLSFLAKLLQLALSNAVVGK